ncbi:MAG: PDZ domain-containing protein [Planctomycetes bacterium]|nr:PDZ domain-containing protein [Planctomycetota bacterium]
MYWNDELKNEGKMSSAVLSNAGGALSDEDCFAEKSKGWIYVLAFVIIGVLLFGIINLFNNPTCPIAQLNTMAQPVALNPCPYCTGGLLDSQGRCNIPDCKIFSPNWGQASNTITSAPVPKVVPKPVLIKQVAMEVAPSAVGQGVVVHSVYGGSWAQKAGLEPYDLIINFNGQKVKDIEQFQALVAKAKAESAVKIAFVRDNKKYESNITIGEGEMEGAIKPVVPLKVQ